MKKLLRAGRRWQMVGKSKSPSRVPTVIQDDSLPRSPLYRSACSRGPTALVWSAAPTPPAGQCMSSSLKNQVPFENILFFLFFLILFLYTNFLKINFIYYYLFIYWLCWVFEAFSSWGEWGVLSSSGTWASQCGGFYCCGAQALRHKGFSSCGSLAQFVAPGFSCSVACGIFLTRDQTHVPWIARQILSPWTTREAPVYTNIWFTKKSAWERF